MFKEGLNGFHLCLEISCSHPCFMENQIWRFKSHGSHIVCHYFISSFFFKREIYFHFFFQRVFIAVHQIFIFSENSNKARIKLYERKGAFWQNTHGAPWKVICASFVRCAFFFEVHLEPWFTSSMILASRLPYLFEVFPTGVSPQNIYIQCLWKYELWRFINQIWHEVSFDQRSQALG